MTLIMKLVSCTKYKFELKSKTTVLNFSLLTVNYIFIRNNLIKICYLIFSSHEENLNHRRMQLEDETCLTYYR